MTTLRSQLAFRYAMVVLVCLGFIAWLLHHEFVEEPQWFKQAGVVEPPDAEVSEWIEIGIFIGIPVLFGIGWWLVRRSLKPLGDLASGVERFNAQTLGQRMPRTFSGDEVDRMAAAFNAMAARLEQSFQQIREFTLHASHELKTPLTVIRAQLETSLSRPDAMSADQRAALENLVDEVARLTKIVDGLTLLTKADAGMVPLEQQPVRLDELVREAAEDAEVLAQPGGITVRLTRCDGVTVLGDRHRLRQVLLNLVDNATKYNQSGGWVELSLQRDGDFAELLVTNTGPGISAELLGRVFERFTRGKEVLSQATEGCGLGLTIARWIVESHQGLIRIASEPGKTTSVAVRLPVAPAPAQISG
jgi:signal transduction histidine kinase